MVPGGLSRQNSARHNSYGATSFRLGSSKLSTNDDFMTQEKRSGAPKELWVHVERTLYAIMEAEDKSAFQMKHCYSAPGGARAYKSPNFELDTKFRGCKHGRSLRARLCPSDNETEIPSDRFKPQSKVTELLIDQGYSTKKLLQDLDYAGVQNEGNEADDELPLCEIGVGEEVL